jgi:hypothetical protein
MRTLLLSRTEAPIPVALRHIIEAGSTVVEEVRSPDDATNTAADRVLSWEPGLLHIGDRRLRWPDDEDEIRLLLQSGG